MAIVQTRYYCICCGYDSLTDEPGHYCICPVCYWEDDPTQRDHPDEEDGANKISLRQAQINFEQFGACEKEMIKNVIKPDHTYRRNPQWKILN